MTTEPGVPIVDGPDVLPVPVVDHVPPDVEGVDPPVVSPPDPDPVEPIVDGPEIAPGDAPVESESTGS